MRTGNKFLDEHVMVVRPRASTTSANRPVIEIEKFVDAWIIGNVFYKGIRYHFETKTFLEKSVFGINKGCISKLMIYQKGLVVNYDRGWDIKPKTENVKTVYRALLRKFNSRMPEECILPWMRACGIKTWTDPRTGRTYSVPLMGAKSTKSKKPKTNGFGL